MVDVSTETLLKRCSVNVIYIHTYIHSILMLFTISYSLNKTENFLLIYALGHNGLLDNYILSI